MTVRSCVHPSTPLIRVAGVIINSRYLQQSQIIQINDASLLDCSRQPTRIRLPHVRAQHAVAGYSVAVKLVAGNSLTLLLLLLLPIQ